jgi:hypothetical protein
MTVSVFDESAPKASLDDLVGEGKKYSNPDELAKAYANAAAYIDQLKSETQGLREDLSQRQTAAEILEEIRKGAQSPAPRSEVGTPPADTPATPPSDEDLVKRIREVTNAEREAEKVRKNAEEVSNRMLELYGEKANDVVREKAQALGVSVDFLRDVAARSPAAFFATVGIEATKTPPATTHKNDVNPLGLSNQRGGATKEGTKAYYDDIRKSNPTLYWTPKIQNQMFKDAKRLGDVFFQN